MQECGVMRFCGEVLQGNTLKRKYMKALPKIIDNHLNILYTIFVFTVSMLLI